MPFGHARVRAAKGSARRALLLAGLFLLRSLTLYADLPPGRTVAPSLAVVPTPEVRASDLQAVRDAAEAAAKRASESLEDQARRLSRTAASLNDLQGELRTQAQSAKALDASIAGVGSTLSELDKRVAALSQSAATKDVDATAQAAKLKNLSDDLAALRQDLEGGGKKMREGLAEIAALREDLKQRQTRLDSLTELLAVMKKDVDSNSEEIVEVKQSLKGYQVAAAPQDKSAGDWWEQALEWKYLPALAVGLSVVAVGLAAAKR
jgi:septal ring factor EnvC (AmiA/AmiB activator)